MHCRLQIKLLVVNFKNSLGVSRHRAVHGVLVSAQMSPQPRWSFVCKKGWFGECGMGALWGLALTESHLAVASYSTGGREQVQSSTHAHHIGVLVQEQTTMALLIFTAKSKMLKPDWSLC